MPDSWAVKQLFPIMPFTVLEEEPRATPFLLDIPAIADGKSISFSIARMLKRPFASPWKGNPYYLGAFLVWRRSHESSRFAKFVLR